MPRVELTVFRVTLGNTQSDGKIVLKYDSSKTEDGIVPTVLKWSVDHGYGLFSDSEPTIHVLEVMYARPCENPDEAMICAREIGDILACVSWLSNLHLRLKFLSGSFGHVRMMWAYAMREKALLRMQQPSLLSITCELFIPLPSGNMHPVTMQYASNLITPALKTALKKVAEEHPMLGFTNMGNVELDAYVADCIFQAKKKRGVIDPPWTYFMRTCMLALRAAKWGNTIERYADELWMKLSSEERASEPVWHQGILDLLEEGFPFEEITEDDLKRLYKDYGPWYLAARVGDDAWLIDDLTSDDDTEIDEHASKATDSDTASDSGTEPYVRIDEERMPEVPSVLRPVEPMKESAPSPELVPYDPKPFFTLEKDDSSSPVMRFVFANVSESEQPSKRARVERKVEGRYGLRRSIQPNRKYL